MHPWGLALPRGPFHELGVRPSAAAQALYLVRRVQLPRGAEVPQDLPTPSQNQVLSLHRSTPRLGDAKQSAKSRQNGHGFSSEAAGLEGTHGLLVRPHSPPRDGGQVYPSGPRCPHLEMGAVLVPISQDCLKTERRRLRKGSR